MKEVTRVLYVNGGVMSRGGIESYMMNYYRNIDRTKIQIDFIVHGFEKGIYDDEIISLGGKIYNIPIKSKNYRGNIKALKKIFQEGQYKIIHAHMDAMSMVVLKLAKKYSIPIRIAHSHNTQHLTNSKIKFFLNEYARKNINKYTTHRFACSKEAGEWLFGEKDKFEIIKNAVDIDIFLFNLALRKKYRAEFDLENKFIIGHVGRFDYQKNHEFIIKEFSEVANKDSNVHLVLVGDGHLKEKIMNLISEYNIEKRVTVLQGRSNIHEIFNIFDLFILPSLFEGLGIVAIEAQINGLTSILANNVPKEVEITGNVEFLDFKSSWSQSILNEVRKNKKRNKIERKLIANKGYCIKHESKFLEKKYLSFLGENYEN